MKYIFIVNPNAGGRNAASKFAKRIEAVAKSRNLDYKIYFTKYKAHAGEIVETEYSEAETVRYFAVGGDGTLLEIARAAIGKENAQIGVFPMGSGNDYIRQFGKAEDFLDIEAQLDGSAIKVDAIETLEGDALNICSLGLDAAVAYNMDKFKRIPFVTGSLAYELSLVKCLLGKIGEELEIRLKTTEGEVNLEGNFIFALAANGQFYGGGYKGAPVSVCNDGLLDFVLIKKPPLIKIPFMVGIYKKGGHLESEKFNDYLSFYRGYEMEIKSKKEAVANRDGECNLVKHEHFKIKPNATSFILPKQAELHTFMQTKRLFLRPWQKSDFDDFYEIMSDEEVMLPAGVSAVTDWLSGYTKFLHYLRNPLAYAIVLRESGKVIGSINYQDDDARNQNAVCSRSIAYELNKNYWGNGYMPETLSAMTENAFENTPTEVLAVGYHNGNLRSKRVIEKCGFTYEGVIQGAFRACDGVLYDICSYSMTKEAYLSRKENKNV